MSVQLTIPSSLTRYADGHSKFNLSGLSVAEVLDLLIEQHPDLKIRLRDERGNLYSYLPMFRNEEKLPLSGLDKVSVQDGDSLEIITLASGG